MNQQAPPSDLAPDPATPYRVLARKYRPLTFSGLIGQDTMVRTLTNAIESDRLAHAYLLTGVRGVGKTTTARIIARALNCIGADGKGGPTPDPCGVCEHCVAITEDRHMDVLEMDAASRTGVDDIRELIAGTSYRPVSARSKIYIVDEVHMLSGPAFNALLKTLEEPPEHVKFVFATTEARKIPITVLSRCQRFDLRRVGEEILASYLTDIAAKEEAGIGQRALALIARAADGSVRDALSLLDQAIAHGAAGETEGEIDEDQVRAMLGLADRTRIFDLFEAVMGGEIKQALELLEEQHDAGADAAIVLSNLLEITHWLTRVKIAPEVADDISVPEAERVRGKKLAGSLAMPVLARAWQMLLKGLAEAQRAPNPLQAAEMVLVRLAYAAELPVPAEIVKSLQQTGHQTGEAARKTPAPKPDAPDPAPPESQASGPMPVEAKPIEPKPVEPKPVENMPTALASPGANLALSTEPEPEPEPETPEPEPAADAPPTPEAPGSEVPGPGSFEEVVELFAAKREGVLQGHLLSEVHLVRFEPGRIEFRPGAHAPRDLANRMGELLSRWTGARWVVSISAETGAPSLTEQAEGARRKRRKEAARHPLVRATLETFPGAKITEVRDTDPAASADGDGGLDAATPKEEDEKA
jgi:DNA polymerase-3 subunit gamma/tau